MKRNMLLTATVLLAGSLCAAESSPKENVLNASKKLDEQANYGWTATVTVPPSAQFRPGPTEGRTEKDGFTHVTMTFFGNPIDIVLRGDRAALTDRDGNWQTVAELEGEEGPARFRANLARSIRTPAAEAAELVSFAKQLKQDGEAVTSELTGEGARTLISFQRLADDPSVRAAKASVKFWIEDGLLSKYEYKVEGAVQFGDNEFEVDRTTTVEIKNVGATRVQPPETARKRLS